LPIICCVSLSSLFTTSKIDASDNGTHKSHLIWLCFTPFRLLLQNIILGNLYTMEIHFWVGKSKWRCWWVWCPMRLAFRFIDSIFSGCPWWWKGQGSFWSLFYKALIPFMGSLLSWLNHFLKAPSINTVNLDIDTLDCYWNTWNDGRKLSDHSRWFLKLNDNVRLASGNIYR
jgi:hypothetical protein